MLYLPGVKREKATNLGLCIERAGSGNVNLPAAATVAAAKPSLPPLGRGRSAGSRLGGSLSVVGNTASVGFLSPSAERSLKFDRGFSLPGAIGSSPLSSLPTLLSQTQSSPLGESTRRPSSSPSPSGNSSGQSSHPATLRRHLTIGEMDEEAQLKELGWAPAELMDFLLLDGLSLRWVGADGTILWANRDELSMLGYLPDEYIGSNILDFHVDKVTGHALLPRLQIGERLVEVPLQFWHKDGSVVHVLLSTSAYYDEMGCFSHTRCFTRNVTATKLAEIERLKLEAEAKAEMARDTALKLRRLNHKWRRSAEMNAALLHQMLPPKVAADLSAGRPVPPEAFDNVTIFFSDIEGFTKISAAVQPVEIVNLLNVLYTVMDYCASLFPVYKVETIGDAYMVVGGLPERSNNHTAAVADFALLVRESVKLVMNPVNGSSSVRLRMGVHSGPVVASVVGNLMPRYCLFGDTVNTASRMESTGESGRIHCSTRTASLLSTLYPGCYCLEERGFIEVKGKGSMETFWLTSGLRLEHCTTLCERLTEEEVFAKGRQ
mmetsp:Transcript_8527/g.18598  ORF Transcript_8527/g.18598 Transcript_8527/m.18598 type:complete len:548 (-) Transcript_8527:23-1666(-)